MSENLYPKPIPHVDKKLLPNEVGFTSTEIAALQNGWRIIKRRIRYHSKKIFMEFFQEHDPLFERFREASGKLNMTRMYQHPMAILHVYGNLIDHGFNDSAHINILLADVSTRHRKHGVKYDEIKLHTDHIRVYVLKYLEKVLSSTFINGLEKLSELINSYHVDKNENEE